MAFLAPVGAFLAANAGTIGTVLSIGSAAVTGISAIQQGNYQAAVARNNAMIADQNAAAAAEAAQIEQARSDREYAGLLGQQLSVGGASGLDLNSASLRRGRMLTRRTRGEAARDIMGQGRQQIMGFQQDSANFRAQGIAARRQGIVTAIGAGLGAAGDIMHQGSLLRRSGGRRPWDSRPTAHRGSYN